MSSNQTIKVFVRSKPLSGNDTTTTDRNVLNIDEAGSIISFSRDRKGQAEFQFSKVFGPSVSQQSVYNECSNVVIQEVTDGVNCCIMAYGQTGSGKTFTMYGKGWDEPSVNPTISNGVTTNSNGTNPRSRVKSQSSLSEDLLLEGNDVDQSEGSVQQLNSTENGDDTETRANTAPAAADFDSTPLVVDDENMLGVIPRCIADLFRVLDDRAAVAASNKTHFDYSINCQVMQIYNEKIFDLLQDRRRENPLQLRESSGTGNGDANTVCVRGMSVFRVYGRDEAFQLLRKGLRNRAVRATDFNSESSRSHTILQLFVMVEEDDAQGVRVLKRSTFSLVDLAGSEKWRSSLAQSVDNTGVGGASSSNIHNSLQQSVDLQLKEMNNINTSLHVLGNCVSALIEVPTRKHIPYRDSILTRLLQDALGGNGRTILIATVHNDQVYREETYSTLQFASRASCIKVVLSSNVSINTDRTSLEQAQKMIKALRGKVLELQQASGSGGESAPQPKRITTCGTCETNNKAIVALKKLLQEAKEVNNYLIDTLDSHYIPYDLGSITHSNKTGSKLNTPNHSAAPSPIASRDSRDHDDDSRSVGSFGSSVFGMLSVDGFPSGPGGALNLSSSIAMQRYAPSPSRQQLIPPSSAEYGQRPMSQPIIIGQQTSDEEEDDDSVVSLSASKVGSVDTANTLRSSGQKKPSSSSGTRKKVKKPVAGSSSKLQAKLKATVGAAGSNQPSPNVRKSNNLQNLFNESAESTPTKLVKPRRVVTAEGLVVDCFEPELSEIHHSVSAPNAVQAVPSSSSSLSRVPDTHSTVSPDKMKTKKSKGAALTPAKDPSPPAVDPQYSPPSSDSVMLAKQRIKQQQNGGLSNSKLKQQSLMPADYSVEAALSAANSMLGIKQPRKSPPKPLRLDPAPIASTSGSVHSLNLSTSFSGAPIPVAAPSSYSPVPSVYVPTDYSSAASVLSSSREFASTLNKHMPIAASRNERAEPPVVAPLERSRTPPPPVPIPPLQTAGGGNCVKHGLEACVLCQMFGAPFVGGGAPSVASVNTAVPRPLYVTANRSAASTNNNTASNTANSTAYSTPAPSPGGAALLKANNGAAASYQSYASSNGSTPSAYASPNRQFASSTITASSTPSVLEMAATTGETCKTHGVTDCLLCAMRAKREGAAANSSSAAAAADQHTPSGSVYGSYTSAPSTQYARSGSPHHVPPMGLSPLTNTTSHFKAPANIASHLSAPFAASLDSNDSKMGYGFVDNNGSGSLSKLRGISYSTGGEQRDTFSTANSYEEYLGADSGSAVKFGTNSRPLVSPYSYSSNTEKRQGVERSAPMVSSSGFQKPAAAQPVVESSRKISPRINEIRSIPQLRSQYQTSNDPDDEEEDLSPVDEHNQYQVPTRHHPPSSGDQSGARVPRHLRELEHSAQQQQYTGQQGGGYASQFQQQQLPSQQHHNQYQQSSQYQQQPNQYQQQQPYQQQSYQQQQYQQTQPYQQHHQFQPPPPIQQQQQQQQYQQPFNLQAPSTQSYGNPLQASTQSHHSAGSHNSNNTTTRRENHRYAQQEEPPSPFFQQQVPAPRPQSSSRKSTIQYEDEKDDLDSGGDDEEEEEGGGEGEEERERPVSRLGTGEMDRRVAQQIDGMMASSKKVKKVKKLKKKKKAVAAPVTTATAVASLARRNGAKGAPLGR